MWIQSQSQDRGQNRVLVSGSKFGSSSGLVSGLGRGSILGLGSMYELRVRVGVRCRGLRCESSIIVLA